MWRRAISQMAVVAVAAATLSSCAVGQGEGFVRGSLVLPDCAALLSQYDMNAAFFGADAVGDQLVIRIQKGGEFQEYVDSLTIAVQDTVKVNARLDTDIPVELERLPGSAPGVPAPLVRMTLSLRGTCGSGKLAPGDNPQVVLHATSGTIRFKSIFRGPVSTRDTNSKRIEGTFDVHVEDPREPAKRPGGRLTGAFKFFYQRGGPAQPFP